MKKYSVIFTFVFITFFVTGCDTKDMAGYVAKEAYYKLANDYNKLVDDYNKLANENQALKNKLAKYEDGFGRMYE